MEIRWRRENWIIPARKSRKKKYDEYKILIKSHGGKKKKPTASSVREGMDDTLMGLVAVGAQLVASLWDLVEVVDVQHF